MSCRFSFCVLVFLIAACFTIHLKHLTAERWLERVSQVKSLGKLQCYASQKAKLRQMLRIMGCKKTVKLCIRRCKWGCIAQSLPALTADQCHWFAKHDGRCVHFWVDVEKDLNTSRRNNWRCPFSERARQEGSKEVWIWWWVRDKKLPFVRQAE